VAASRDAHSINSTTKLSRTLPKSDEEAAEHEHATLFNKFCIISLLRAPSAILMAISKRRSLTLKAVTAYHSKRRQQTPNTAKEVTTVTLIRFCNRAADRISSSVETFDVGRSGSILANAIPDMASDVGWFEGAVYEQSNLVRRGPESLLRIGKISGGPMFFQIRRVRRDPNNC